MGSSKSVTIGYWYSLGIHMGLCRGPVNAVTKIMAAGKTVWTEAEQSNIWYPPKFGMSFVPYPPGPIYLDYYMIDKPGLFGGEKKEGGVSGNLYIFMGERTQTTPAVLRSALGGEVPAFRGVTTLYFNGRIAAMNPYIKPWEIWAWRTTAGWENDDPWYPERATILLTSETGETIHAMNPAHIIYECHTNHDWGGGNDRSTIDDAQLRAAADILYAENFGLCLDWVRQETVVEFIGLICEHIGATWRQNRLTGLFELKLIRGDYDPETLPLFDEDTGLLGIDEEESTGLDEAANEIIVKWEEPMKMEARQWRERNLAAITATGQIISETVEYPGIPTASIAGRLAVRDLEQRAAGLKRFKLRLDRRAYKIQIGDVFRIKSTRRGIENLILRAGRVEDGTLDKGEIGITAIQDVFGLPAAAISAPPPGNWVEPDKTPHPVATRQPVELTWRDLAAWLDPANLELLKTDPTAAYIALLARAPTALSYGFGLQTRVEQAEWENHEDGIFAGTALLATAIPIGAGIVIIKLAEAHNLDDLAPNDALLIDNEILRVDEVNLLTGEMALARGCVDTVPAAHTVETRVWRFDDAAAPATAWTNGTTVQIRALTKTSTGTLPEDQALASNLTLIARQGRPYPPGNFKINGNIYPANIPGGTALAATSAAASSTDPDRPDPPDYIATAEGGEQWIWWRFASAQSLGRITLTGGATANGKSLADMLNGCEIQYSTSTASTPTNWVSTGITISGITDTGNTKDFNLPGITCRAIRLYKTDGQVGILGASLTAGGITFKTAPAALAVTWSHRDRIIQADQLIDTTQGNIGPEIGVTYRLRIYSPDGTLRRTYSGITGTSQTYALANEIADGGTFTALRVVLDAMRDGLYSYQAHDWEVKRT
jgi:hypothetical protein